MESRLRQSLCDRTLTPVAVRVTRPHQHGSARLRAWPRPIKSETAPVRGGNRVLTPANQTPLVSKSARVSISTEQSEQTLKFLETDTSKWELFQQSTVDLFRQFSCSEEMKLTT